jgi:hypothetical protein
MDNGHESSAIQGFTEVVYECCFTSSWNRLVLIYDTVE